MRPRQIAPEYSFRFTPQDIHATYGSADGAFARGDFLNAAQWAPAGSELKGCSLILGGLLEQGLAILDRLPDMSGRARLCQALALWSLGREADAKAALARSDDAAVAQATRKFQALLARDDVTIFITGAILSVFPEHYSESFIAPVYKYGAITVKYVGSQLPENAYDYSATDSLSAFIEGLPPDEQPDILFSLSPQWLLAKDFHKVARPEGDLVPRLRCLPVPQRRQLRALRRRDLQLLAGAFRAQPGHAGAVLRGEHAAASARDAVSRGVHASRKALRHHLHRFGAGAIPFREAALPVQSGGARKQIHREGGRRAYAREGLFRADLAREVPAGRQPLRRLAVAALARRARQRRVPALPGRHLLRRDCARHLPVPGGNDDERCRRSPRPLRSRRRSGV